MFPETITECEYDIQKVLNNILSEHWACQEKYYPVYRSYIISSDEKTIVVMINYQLEAEIRIPIPYEDLKTSAGIKKWRDKFYRERIAREL